MEFRKMTFDGITYNVLTEKEMNELIQEVQFKAELEFQHEKLLHGEVETMELEDFEKKHRLRYEI
ncbi:MAG: hypothetical protein LUG12_03560 [Erysipelotrichaceae bacterium]|nr:hypothetical protein [Erysipelotrichaceae bacterium]